MSANFKITPNAEQLPVEIVGSSTFGRYPKISCAYSQNMYISEEWFINFPGYKKALEIAVASTGRGLFHSIRGNVLIAVVGAKVYRIDNNFNVNPIGDLATAFGEVFMDENLNNQICIVDGLNAYIVNHDLPINFTTQGGGPLGTNLIPNYVCFHDTFFLIGNAQTDNNGSQWYAYAFDTPTTIKAVTQLALQTKPDFAIAIESIPSQANNVLVFGRTVCEIHMHVGGTQNYRRNSSINIDFGCLSVSTIASSDQYVAWLGANETNAPVIMVYQGQGAQSISTDGIDFLLGRIKFPSQSTALFYKQDGHLFYHLTFFNPVDNLSIIYDFDTKKFFHITDRNENFHPARETVYYNLKTYFLSLTNGALYESSTDFVAYDENIEPYTSPDYDPLLVYDIPRTRIAESIRKTDSARFIANSFVFTMEQGTDIAVTGLSINSAHPNAIITEDNFNPANVDLITENNDNVIVSEFNTQPVIDGEALPFLAPTSLTYRPRVDMSISKDCGITWSNTVSRYLNPIGERQNIITFGNLGRANDLTIKLKFWGKCRFIVRNGVVDVY